MNYYVIDDTPNTIRQLKISFEKLKENFFWIDTTGEKKKDPPSNYLEFPFPLSEDFKKKICSYINDDSIFLVDLALNNAERKAVEEKYIKKSRTTVFSADVASEIINTLKKYDNNTRIKVISGIWKPGQDILWSEPLAAICSETWFSTIKFIPTGVVKDAHFYPATKTVLEN